MLLVLRCTLFLLHNVGKEKDTPWEKLWNQPFHGTTLPFGCLVIFKDNVERRDTALRKWDHKGSLGVFAGYRIHPGYTWKGEYLVWELDSFQKSDLQTLSTYWQGVLHVTKVCHLPAAGLSFPLKKD